MLGFFNCQDNNNYYCCSLLITAYYCLFHPFLMPPCVPWLSHSGFRTRSFSSTASLTLTTLQHIWTISKSICKLQKRLWKVLRWDHNTDLNSSKDKNCTRAYLCKKWMHDYLLKAQISIDSDSVYFLRLCFTRKYYSSLFYQMQLL